jgi:hypothetical protein
MWEVVDHLVDIGGIVYHPCLNFIIPPLPGGGYTVFSPSVPRYFSSHFSQQLLMTGIWYLVLLPVCQLSWSLYTLNIYAHFSSHFSQQPLMDPSDSYFLFANIVDFYTHWTYMLIFLSNYWWQKSDISSQASYRYPISWEAFFDPSNSYFVFAEERGYHKWAWAHSSSCFHKF